MKKFIESASMFLIPICVIVMLAGCGGSIDKPSARQSDVPEKENNQAKSVSRSTSIPNNYPSDFCPVYEPSTIIDAEQINVEDKVNYIIKIVSKDELTTIEAFYLELDNISSNMSFGGVICQILLEKKSEKHSGIINIEPIENSDFASYADDGYKTFITIMVDIGW